MKHALKITAMLAAVLLFVACEKEKTSAIHERDITYTVTPDGTTTSLNIPAGEPTTVHLTTEDEWDALLDKFCDYTEDGCTVNFHKADNTAKGSGSKETVSYSTKDREQMKAWMKRMENAGKTVTVTYDRGTGTYSGVAYANEPHPSTGLLTYSSGDTGLDFRYIMSFDTTAYRVYITLHSSIQYTVQPDYITGVYNYRPAYEVDTPFAYWLIDSNGDTAGLYTLQGIGSDTLRYNSTVMGSPAQLVRDNSWQTYYCTDLAFDVVMHLKPISAGQGDPASAIKIDAQTDANHMGDISCSTPFVFHRIVMVYPASIQLGSGTYIRISYYEPTPDGAFSHYESITILGDPGFDDIFIIKDTSSNACSDTYTFNRVG